MITTLGVGGAEILLERLVGALDEDKISSSVAVLGPLGPIGARIAGAGTPVTALRVAGWRDMPRAAVQLAGHMRRARPDVVHTWMYHADLVGGVVARGLGLPAVWSVHQTDLPAGQIRRMTRVIARVNARLSSFVPRRIVYTSHRARLLHERRGYAPGRGVTILNATPVPAPVGEGIGDHLRRQLGIPLDAVVAVRLGRNHPQKDWPTLLWAVAAVARPELRLIGAGAGVTDAVLEPVLRRLGAARTRIHLLGLRDDVDALHAAADLAVSSSAFGESAPLVVPEAMHAGLPVVTTDVGDCAHMVGSTGWIVPPRDVGALARALAEAVAVGGAERAARGQQARQRAEQVLGFPGMVDAYERLYAEVARRRA